MLRETGWGGGGLGYLWYGMDFYALRGTPLESSSKAFFYSIKGWGGGFEAY